MPSAWETVTVPSPPTSLQRSAHTSPRLMPVVSVSSMARPSGFVASAATASLSMRVRAARSSAFMGVFTHLGGLQNSQTFLRTRSCDIAHLSACFSRRKGLATDFGA